MTPRGRQLGQYGKQMSVRWIGQTHSTRKVGTDWIKCTGSHFHTKHVHNVTFFPIKSDFFMGIYSNLNTKSRINNEISRAIRLFILNTVQDSRYSHCSDLTNSFPTPYKDYSHKVLIYWGNRKKSHGWTVSCVKQAGNKEYHNSHFVWWRSGKYRNCTQILLRHSNLYRVELWYLVRQEAIFS